MTGTPLALFAFYLFGGAVWFLITLMVWSVDRQFPSTHSEEDISEKARRVLMTPVWPLALLGIIGRGIGLLQKDVMKP